MTAPSTLPLGASPPILVTFEATIPALSQFALTVDASGVVSATVDGGATTTRIDFTDPNVIVEDSLDGSRLHVDVSGLHQVAQCGEADERLLRWLGCQRRCCAGGAQEGKLHHVVRLRLGRREDVVQSRWCLLSCAVCKGLGE